jgi:hypothetical protein
MSEQQTLDAKANGRAFTNDELREMDVELFVGKPPKFVRPPQDWLDAQTQQTRDALGDLETAARALEAIDAEIIAAQAHVVECADVLRIAQDRERANGGPLTRTQLAKEFIRSEQARR